MGFLAIDIGGTRIRAGWFNAGLELQQRSETLSLAHQGREAMLQHILDTARAVLPEPKAEISAIGVAAPGPLDPEAGIVYHAESLPGWLDVPLVQIIGQAFGGVPVRLNNDANLAALAEYHFGAGQGADPMLYLTLSTGIGGGAVLNGRLFTGWRGLATEPGHMRFTLPDGQVCRLEDLASGTALARQARQQLVSSGMPSVLRAAPVIDGQAVGEAAASGDALGLDVVQTAGRWLGLGLVNLLHLFNPQAVVIGGSVAQLGALILDPARSVMEQHLMLPQFDDPDLIRLSRLGDNAGLVGAALIARQSV